LGEQTVRFWYKGKKLRRRAEVQCSLEEFIERWIQHIPEHYQHAVRWPAAHVQDVAHLYRLALEKREAGSRYNAVAEEGIPMREIAAVIGKGLKVPVVSLPSEKAQSHFGWLAMFVGFDMPASSAQTRKRLGWNPRGSGLIADLENMQYFQA